MGGHSFDTEPPSQSLTRPVKRISCSAMRSPGFVPGLKTPDVNAIREFAAGHDQSALRELLRENPSPKKRTLGLFSRTGRKKRASKEVPVAKSVAKAKTSKGNSYFQIACDQIELENISVSPKELTRFQNSSTYVLNKRIGQTDKTESTKDNFVDEENAKTGQENTALVALDPVRNEEKYYLGIKKRYPHLLLGGSNKDAQDTESKLKNVRQPANYSRPDLKPDPQAVSMEFGLNESIVSPGPSLTALARHECPLFISDDTPAQEIHIDGMPTQIKAYKKFRSDLAKSETSIPAAFGETPHLLSPAEASSKNTEPSVQIKAPLYPEIFKKKASSQSNHAKHSVRLDAKIPKTPQHSAENSIESKKSPGSSKQSKAPSVLSAQTSTIDEIQSDAGSAVIMSAQLAGTQNAASYYPGGFQIPPKPGPPPTGALPSLPEGHNGSSFHKTRFSENFQGRNSIDSALKRSPGKGGSNPPTARYRLSPTKVSGPKLAVTSEGEKPTQLEKSPIILSLGAQTAKNAIPAPCKSPTSVMISSTALQRKQIQRERSTKALKERDLEVFRSNQGKSDAFETKSTNNHVDSHILPNLTYLPNRVDVESVPRTSIDHPKGLGHLRREYQIHPRAPSTLSPIIIVAEQEPSTKTSEQAPYDSRIISQNRLRTPGNVKKTEEARIDDEKFPVLRAVIPDEMIQPEDKTRENSTHPKIRSRQPQMPERNTYGSDENRLSITDAADLEARLEARIRAVETKNILLQEAFMAVVNGSAMLSASSGDRSSGLSTSSSLYGPVEARLGAKCDAILASLQEKRLSKEL